MKIKYTKENIFTIGLSMIILVKTIGMLALIYQQSTKKQDYDNLKASIENKQPQIDSLKTAVCNLHEIQNIYVPKAIDDYMDKGIKPLMNSYANYTIPKKDGE